MGVGWRNAFEGDYSLADCLAFMAFDGLWYLALAAYLETVAPAQHGSPRHPLFFLQPPLRALLRGSASLAAALGFPAAARRLAPSAAVASSGSWAESAAAGAGGAAAASGDHPGGGGGGGSGRQDEEPVPALMGAPAVAIAGLVKDYGSAASSGADGSAWGALGVAVQGLFCGGHGGGRQRLPASLPPPRKRPAVDGLSLDLWAGQVTCLLGHNGAGRVTGLNTPPPPPPPLRVGV